MEDNKIHETKVPTLGDRLPELDVRTTHGQMKLPDDFKGKWIVLFSHPADFTPVCTTEFVGFARKEKEFEALNAQLIGLSIDQLTSHLKWVQWIGDNLDTKIPFPVIADDLGEVALKLGMVHSGKGTNTVRAVYIIDPNGIVRLSMLYPQEIGRSVDEVIRALKALQIADKNKVAMPENWPNNPLFGDKVILPPPRTEEEMMKRLEEVKKNPGLDFKDWWLVLKNLDK